MALVTEEDARRRSNEGTRGPVVLEEGEVLSPSAREYLTAHRVEVVRPKWGGGYRTEAGEPLQEKPEHMTHLRGNLLVEKNHPRIRFRGRIDSLEGEILLCQQACGDFPRLVEELEEVLSFVRNLIRCDVLEEKLERFSLCGYTPDELREHSHHPERYYGQSHFLPHWQDGTAVLALNRVRTLARETELTAYDAFHPQREDIILGLNRLSSLLWILMIKAKAGRYGGDKAL